MTTYKNKKNNSIKENYNTEEMTVQEAEKVIGEVLETEDRVGDGSRINSCGDEKLEIEDNREVLMEEIAELKEVFINREEEHSDIESRGEKDSILMCNLEEARSKDSDGIKREEDFCREMVEIRHQNVSLLELLEKSEESEGKLKERTRELKEIM